MARTYRNKDAFGRWVAELFNLYEIPAVFHRDGNDMVSAHSGAPAMKYKNRSLRQQGRQQIKRYMVNDNYQVMVRAKPTRPYWDI
jgi:hypothetical protein